VIVPPEGCCTLQVTAVLVVPVTLAANDCVWPGNIVKEFGVTMTDMASAVIGLGDMVGDEPPPHPLVVKAATAVTTTKAKPCHTHREFMGTLSDSGLTFARVAP
jgi:hypothetical protein